MDRYNIRQFSVEDDNFSFDRERACTILEGVAALDKGISICYSNGLSLRTLDRELVGLMKKAGAREIHVSIESGNEYIRNKVYGKAISTEKIYEVYDACKYHDISISVNYMIGAPNESDETIGDTINMMKRIHAPVYVNFTTPFKGTKLYDYFMQRGLIDEKVYQEGVAIDLRTPVEGLHDSKKMFAWRRKIGLYNLLYSWKEILVSSGLVNINSFVRFLQVILRKRINVRTFYAEISNKYMPL